VTNTKRINRNLFA